MIPYDWDFGRLAPYWDVFVSGIGVTVLLSLATITFALTVGALWGAALSRIRLLRLISLPIIDVLKSLPPLVVVLFGYFALSPNVVGFSAPAFIVFTIFVGTNLSAFVADLVRSAVTNVPREFVQIGFALGLNERQILVRVIAPIAIRELIPPLAYLSIETIKLTSLASVIFVHEMVYVAQGAIQETSRSLEAWVVVSLVYIALIWPTTLLVRQLEIRMKRTAGLQK